MKKGKKKKDEPPDKPSETLEAETMLRCSARDSEFSCTRTLDHDGDHEAHDLLGQVVHSWKGT